MKRTPESALLRAILPTALASMLLLLPGSASAAPSDSPADPVFPTADNTSVSDLPAADNGWVDRYHSGIEKRLLDTAIWFDRFFGDEKMEFSGRPESLVRWKNEFQWDQEDRFSFRSTLRAILRLPRLKKRWKLAFSGETRGDPNEVTPEDPGNPGLAPESRVRTGSTELIYEIVKTPRSILDTGAGIRVKIPMSAFARTRFQYAVPVGNSLFGRFTATVYWDAKEGFGESNRIDLERSLNPVTLLRWSNSIAITEQNWDRDGWGFGSELSLLRKLAGASALTLGAGASGTTRSGWTTQLYRVFARYRRNVWREWLFLEGEPYLRWPRMEGGGREAAWGGTLRMEVLFRGAVPGEADSGE